MQPLEATNGFELAGIRLELLDSASQANPQVFGEIVGMRLELLSE